MAPLQEATEAKSAVKWGINKVTLSLIPLRFKEDCKNNGGPREGFYRNIDSDSLI